MPSNGLLLSMVRALPAQFCEIVCLFQLLSFDKPFPDRFLGGGSQMSNDRSMLRKLMVVRWRGECSCALGLFFSFLFSCGDMK